MSAHCIKCHRPLRRAPINGMGPVCAKRNPVAQPIERDLFGFDIERACEALRGWLRAQVEARAMDCHFYVTTLFRGATR